MMDNNEFNEAMQGLGEYWNRTSDVNYEDEERRHPCVGKIIVVTNNDYPNLYNKQFIVTRAYECKEGIIVRIGRKDGTVTLKPDEYKFLK